MSILDKSYIKMIMRISGKDILNQKINKTIKSYWIKKTKTVSLMKNQF